ncbi:MAG: type II toxin-antitoxin system VapC family toxin [Methanotrichaceae archaeon]
MYNEPDAFLQSNLGQLTILLKMNYSLPRHRVAFYDSLYIAAAKRERAPLLTLDKKLFERVKGGADIQLI